MIGKARPALLVERDVEARQHDGAVRQRGDDLEQPRRGRNRAGRPGRDHRVRRALQPLGGKPLGFTRHQRVAALDRRDEAIVGEIARPVLGDDLEELDRALPMRGEIVRHDGIERGKIDLLRFDDIHQPREVGRETGGLAGGDLPADRVEVALGRRLGADRCR